MIYYWNLSGNRFLKWLYKKWLPICNRVDSFFSRHNKRLEKRSYDAARKDINAYVLQKGGDRYLEKFIEHDSKVMNLRAMPLGFFSYGKGAEKWKDI